MLSLLQFCIGDIEVGYICSVVFGMVDLHDFGRYLDSKIVQISAKNEDDIISKTSQVPMEATKWCYLTIGSSAP